MIGISKSTRGEKKKKCVAGLPGGEREGGVFSDGRLERSSTNVRKIWKKRKMKILAIFCYLYEYS